ncbi:MAG: TolC family protein, partial [Muribaculaceae bacterium]|nr:TolC family protein [Muribaculaceae bacterium]
QTLSWEADLWGGLKWARRKGGADFRASVEQERAMRITLIAEAASAYFRLIALDNELQIARRTLFTREENLQKAKIRFEGGMTPETVYRQAEVEYATTASLIPDLELRIVAMRNALTLLMGDYPHEIDTRQGFMFDSKIGSRMPVGATSDLLRRRPDLQAAEMRLKAAMEDVGVSYADRFPSLRLGFTPGFENDGLKNFFKSPFTYVVGSIAGTVLDFGRKKRKYEASIAAYDQSRYAYEQAVISAFTEVNTAITAFQKYRENMIVQQELMEAAKKYVELARLQYMGGTLNYIDVLDAQRRYFSAQIGVNHALLDEYLALINLYRCLGGGTD